MAMLGSRLQTALAADFLTRLQSAFPISGSLLAGEQTAAATAQTSLANALAAAAGPDVVAEVLHATVLVTAVTSGGATAPGTVT